jgi:hypothetical protein
MYRMLAIVLLVCLTGCSQQIPEEKQAEFLEAIDEIASGEEAKEAARSAAAKAFVAKPKIPTSTCEEVVVLDWKGEAASNKKFPRSDKNNLVSASSVDELEEASGTRLEKFRESADILRRRITGDAHKPFEKKNIDHVAQRIDKLADRDGYRYEIHYVIREIEHHDHEGEKVPVDVEGRAFVWDYDKGEIICAADAVGTLRDGDTIMVSYKLDDGSPTEDDKMRSYKYGLKSKVRRTALRKIGIGVDVEDDYDYSNVK